MGFYTILDGLRFPSSRELSDYKGLDRASVFPTRDQIDDPIMPIVWRYIGSEEAPGATLDRISIDELKSVTAFFQRQEMKPYELIYFEWKEIDSPPDCPQPTLLYGIDITGYGGYSQLVYKCFWENGQNCPDDTVSRKIWRVLKNKRNKYGLLSDISTAKAVLKLLTDYADFFEKEEWRMAFVYKVL